MIQIESVERSQWLAILQTMVRARLTEERLIRLYHQGKIFGGVYTGIGQEAIGAATTGAAQAQDLFAPCIRSMTVHLGRGTTVLGVFRQYLGRVTGPTGGRDGNVHYGNLEAGVYTMISHLGAMLPVIVGGVMARRRRGQDAVGIAYIGDGGTSTGDFHEAVNFAAVFNVPVVFLIENNKFAYSTPISEQFKCERLIDRAPGYGIEGYEADGNDAVTLYLLTSEILERLRREPKPLLLECDTLRMRGHGEHDAASYIPESLMDTYKIRDPVEVMKKRLIETDVATEAELDAIANECRSEVNAAYQQALAESRPNPDTLLDGVYANA